MAGPYDISAIMAEMERALIESQRRNLSKHMSMVKKNGSNITQWQALKLAGLRGVQIENGKIVSRYNTQATRAIQDLLAGDFNKATQAAVDKFGAAGALTQVPDAWNRNFFGVNEPKLAALVDATAGEVRAASASALRYMDDQYRQTVFKAAAFHNTGSFTLAQSLDMASKDFLASGIRSIAYANGHQVNIASYAEMAIRTASARTAAIAQGAIEDEWDYHLVQFKRSGRTCELCAPWQGRVVIDDVFGSGKQSEGKYPLMSAAIDSGLGHPNCRHIPASPWFGEIPPPPPTKEEQARAVDKYAAEQKQRQIENEIRKNKRLEVGSTDPANVAKYQGKVREWQAAQREHMRANPDLRRQYVREHIVEKRVPPVGGGPAPLVVPPKLPPPVAPPPARVRAKPAPPPSFIKPPPAAPTPVTPPVATRPAPAPKPAPPPPIIPPAPAAIPAAPAASQAAPAFGTAKYAEFQKLPEKQRTAKKLAEMLHEEAGLGHVTVKWSQSEKYWGVSKGYLEKMNYSTGIATHSTTEVGIRAVAKDKRPPRYSRKTAFHETYHSAAHGALDDTRGLGDKYHTMIEETFAECFANHAIKQVEPDFDFMPSYSNYLTKVVPRLKKLPEFASVKSFEDVGEIVSKYRFGAAADKTAQWTDLYNRVMGVSHVPEVYEMQYIPYIKANRDRLIEKIGDLIPTYKDPYFVKMARDAADEIVSNSEAAGKIILTGHNQKSFYDMFLSGAMQKVGIT